jgi:hypothetical protein
MRHAEPLRRRLKRGRDDVAVVDRLRAARTGCVVQAVQTDLGIAVTPLDHRRPGDPEPARDRGRALTVGGCQHDPGPKR